MTRQVTVNTNTRDITYYDTAGELKTLGRLGIDKYGDEANRLIFVPHSENNWAPATKGADNPYVLGYGSGSLNFVNPSDVQELILDMGFEIDKQYAFKGGTQMQTLFRHPKIEFPDAFDYDLDFWKKIYEGRGRELKQGMYAGATLETNVQPGRVAARISFGIYRLICTNGMVGEMLGIKSVDVKHGGFSEKLVKEAMHKRFGYIDGEVAPTGPSVTTAYNLKKAFSVLNDYQNARREAKENKTDIDPRFMIMEQDFRQFSPNVVKNWAFDGYIEQLQMLTDNVEDATPITGLHLVNAYTSGVNAHQMMRGTDRGSFDALAQTANITKATASLANLAALFSKS